MLKVILISAALSFMACAHDQCNNLPQRPLASDEGGTSPMPSPAATNTTPPAAAAEPIIPPDSIQIFKATGETQCEGGNATNRIPLDKMQSTLSSKKITVFESHTQSDGKMHMQLCGSPAGTVHVFTISKKYLKAAEKLGFKIFISKGH
jgi:hypothetical protein